MSDYWHEERYRAMHPHLHGRMRRAELAGIPVRVFEQGTPQ